MEPQPPNPKPNYTKPLIGGVVGLAVVTLALMVASRQVGDAPPAPSGATSAPKPATSFHATNVRTVPKRSNKTSPAVASTTPVSELLVPKVTGAIAIDGELEDDAWRGPLARTGTFTDAKGADGRPYTDTRLMWGDGKLYLVLYAADEDIHTAKGTSTADQMDTFHIVFDDGKVARSIDVNPLGVIVDGSRPSGGPADAAFSGVWKSGATAGHDLDGTPDDPKDQDEEWVIEMAVPLASLGLNGKPGERIGFSVSRCDKPKDTPRVCAGWGTGWGTTTPSSIVLQ